MQVLNAIARTPPLPFSPLTQPEGLGAPPDTPERTYCKCWQAVLWMPFRSEALQLMSKEARPAGQAKAVSCSSNLHLLNLMAQYTWNALQQSESNFWTCIEIGLNWSNWSSKVVKSMWEEMWEDDSALLHLRLSCWPRAFSGGCPLPPMSRGYLQRSRHGA